MKAPLSYKAKLMSRDELIRRVAQWRLLHKKVAFTNGCFDILHAGHIATLSAAAAEADFAIAFYNPISSQRSWQLTAAKEILLKSRLATTPVILARNLGRSGQEVRVIMLGELTPLMAEAIFNCDCTKYLIPLNKHGIFIPGVKNLQIQDFIQEIANELKAKF